MRVTLPDLPVESRLVRILLDTTPDESEALKTALVRRRVAPLVRTYLGKTRAGRG